MNYEQLIALAMFASSFANFLSSVFFYCVNDPSLYSSLYRMSGRMTSLGGGQGINEHQPYKFSVNEDAFYSSNLSSLYSEFAYFPEPDRIEMREYVREMFYHGYRGYMKHAFPLDELNPINCSGRGPDQNQANIHLNDALGNFSLGLIDTLDTLYVIGDRNEFRRAVSIVANHVTFDTDTNVQVFEANIRVLGGLLSAHILAASSSPSSQSSSSSTSPTTTKSSSVSSSMSSSSLTSSSETTSNTQLSLEGDSEINSLNLSSTSSSSAERPSHQNKPTLLSESSPSNADSTNAISSTVNQTRLSVASDVVDHSNSNRESSNDEGSAAIETESVVVSNYDNELYDLALDLATRLLPAFRDSQNGLPHPRVNLKRGVLNEPHLQQNVNCLAGVGTLVLEFGLLSHLSGDPIYERVARNALSAVWSMRNNVTSLLGNSFDIHSMRWQSTLSGLGAGMDSFYEYLIKAYVMFNEQDYLTLFREAYQLVSIYNKEGRFKCLNFGGGERGNQGGPPLFRNVDLRNGEIATNWIDSLQAAWPGILVLYGDIEEAICQHALHFAIWQKYSALPERFNLVSQSSELHFYPLRPELAESTYLLYRATKSPFYLHVGRIIAQDINKYTRTSCGFATMKDVKTKTLEDRMESFVLSETFKYLYLLFDEDNYLHSSDLAGKYLFSTEGHVLPVVKYSSSTGSSWQSTEKGAASDGADSTLNWFWPKNPLPVDNSYAQQNPTCDTVPFLYQHSLPLPPHLLHQIERLVGLHS